MTRGVEQPPAHIIYLDGLLHNKNLSSFKLVKSREANLTCGTCKKAPFNQSGLCGPFKGPGLDIISDGGNAEHEDRRKYRGSFRVETDFIRLIRNTCFPQTGKPS